ncbi:MAG: glycosyltransferase family 4 protein [Gemmobacter sp.]|nr:glycosyltransferase family 4 protein [Gemmobacter sp.]
MTLQKAAFAIPGDINTLTGGYIYERRLLEGLRAQGRDVDHIALGNTFPTPSDADMAQAAALLTALPADRPLILDGLVFGSIDTSILRAMASPIVAMIHHPLAHESGLDPDLRAHLFRTERDNLTHAAHVLVTSPHTAALLASDYGVAPDRITIVRPGTDRPIPTAKQSGPPLILSVGIQHPRKGHDILLHALSRLLHRDWQAVIVGSRYDEGNARDLDALHERLGLAGRVRLAGRVSGEELAHCYSTATIFALATRYEGYGIVFDEALSYGLPIVSCRTGAVPDTVPATAGLLVPPEDPDAFAQALDRMLTDPDLRAAKAQASGQFGAALPSWSDTARRAGDVLDRLS